MAGASLEDEAKQKLAFLILVGVLCAGLVAAMLALSITGENIVLLTAIIGAIGFVVTFPFPKLAVVIVILFAQVQYLFTGFYGALINYPIFPVTFQWLDEVVLLALLGNLTLTKLIKGRDQPLEKSPAIFALGLMFLVGVISARLNGVPLLTGLLGQRYVFEMVILYLAIINLDFDERFLRGLVYLLLGIGVFQAFVGVFEFVDKNDLYMAGNHDIVQGTWGGGSANNIGIFFLCLAVIVLAQLRRKWDSRTAMLFGIYVILLVLTSCRSGIVLSPLLFLWVVREKIKNPKYWIAVVVAVVFLAGCLAFYYKNSEAEVSRDLGGGEFAFQVFGRSRVLPLMNQVLHNFSRFPPIGAGPGTYLTAMGQQHGSRMFMEVMSMLRTEEVILPFISASYAVVWMEYGLVGLILFVTVLVRLFTFSWQQEKVIKSLFWRDYFRALQAIIIMYAAVGALFPLWTQFQTSIYLWLFPAIGVRYVVVERRAQARSAREELQQKEEAPRLLPLPARLEPSAT